MADVVNTTRGVPFDPEAAKAMRLAREEQKAEKQAREAEQQAREARQQAIQQQKEARRQARRRRFDEIDDAYYERRTGKSRLATQ